ncbi:MAG: ABC transporter ATP-binding protein, partial [Micrococcales bacterium]
MESQGTIRTLLRIFPFAKRALPRIILGTIAAIASHAFALAIPVYLRDLVNSLKIGATSDQLFWLVMAVVALGTLQAIGVLLRRWLVLTPGTHVEAGLRRALYAKLQDLPVAFHDRWGSGQLLSRATGDLSLIRRWLSFGIVLFVANSLTILIGLGILFTYNWILGLIFFLTSIPIWLKGFQFEKNYHEAARRSQDQAGDLATDVEESVHGIRILKAFGRGSQALEKFASRANELRSTELHKAALIGGIWVYLILVPEFAMGLSLFAGVFLVSTGAMDVGQLV